MKSITAEKLRLDNEPVAIIWSNTKPEGALQIKPHGRSCIMPFFAQVAMKGKTAAFDRESYSCPGALAGLGFGHGYYDAFGGAGIEFMSAFFVKGVKSSKNPDTYCTTMQHIQKRERAKFLHGERLHRNPDKATQFMTADLPITNIAEKYVIFTPISKVKHGESPVVVMFVADHRASHVGWSHPRRYRSSESSADGDLSTDRALVYDEAKKEHPRAVL